MIMRRYKYLILGAGPAGLSLACRLLQKHETDFLVLEAEHEAGGLCRSVKMDGADLDIGGGHFLDAANDKACGFLFQFMPREEWNRFERNSQIQLGEERIHHPIEANIWEMSLDRQVEYLLSIAEAGCSRRTRMPEKFTDWIRWKLGDKITDEYMMPYNRKMFGGDLDILGTYWLNKLPDVSFEDTLRSCLTHKAYGKQPGHACFYYPKRYGYGELWKRMAQTLEGHILYDTRASRLDPERRAVNEAYAADRIITTIPWKEFEEITGPMGRLESMIKRLKHTSVAVEYFPQPPDTDAHWLYCPDPEKRFHRILARANFLPGSRGYWTETNVDRLSGKVDGVYQNAYAYPLNTLDKPRIMRELLREMEQKGVTGLGRWGEWEHYNSDAVVCRALELADSLCG